MPTTAEATRVVEIVQTGLPLALTVGVVAFLLGVIWGTPLLEILRRLRAGKQIRTELVGHQKKGGTPTMGGIMILLPTLTIALALNLASVVREISGASILLPLFMMLGFALLGIIDDWQGFRRARTGKTDGQGLSGRLKFLLQIGLAGVFAVVFSLFNGGFQFANQVPIPLLNIAIPISPLLFIPLCIFIIVGTSNALNLTDGLDGLAGSISAFAFAAYGIIAYLQGQIYLVQLCFIVVGGCFAFLWYNAHPAQMFMGDVGSLSLGGLLGTIAIMTGQWLLLPLIAIVPLAETVSVMLQVTYFKLTKGQRLFKMTPLHHHFELVGWSETQIVQRFWLVGLLSAMIGVAIVLL